MFGTEIVLTLILMRVILPIGLLLLLGEWVRQQERQYRSG